MRFRRFPSLTGMWSTRRFRLALVVAALLLLGINLVYSFFILERHVNPDKAHVTKSLQKLDGKTRTRALQWTQSQPQDTLRLKQFWEEGVPEEWNDQGISLLLFEDTTLVYWSRYPYTSDRAAEWLEQTHTLRQIGGHQVLTRLYRHGARSAVVVFILRDQTRDRYNSFIFPEQRINLLTADDYIRADLVQAVRIEAADNTFYIEAKPMQSLPWYAELCGWLGIVFFALWLKKYFEQHSQSRHVILGALSFLALLVLFRIGLYYVGIPNVNGKLFAKIYGLHNVVLGSLADTLINYLLLFFYVSYLYSIRRRLLWQYIRLARAYRILVSGGIVLITALVVAIFHYLLLLSVYAPQLNIQIYDLFDLSFYSVMFYLLVAIFVANCVLLNQLSLILLSRRSRWLQIIVTGALLIVILLQLYPSHPFAGLYLAAFYSLYAFLFYYPKQISHSRSFVLSVIAFSLYLTAFVSIENNAAQTNTQKLYARILATTSQDRMLRRHLDPATDELDMDVRFRKFTYARTLNDHIYFKPNNSNDYEELAGLMDTAGDTLIHRQGKIHFLYHYFTPDQEPGVIVVTRNAATPLDILSLAVYIFLLLFILSGLLLLSTGFSFNTQYLGTRLTFRIRTFILGIVILAMVCVIWVIIGHTFRSIQEDKQRSIHNNLQRLSVSLSQYLQHTAPTHANLERWLSGEESLTGFSINLYGDDGRLIASSAGEADTPPLPRMSSEAYRRLHYLNSPFYAFDLRQTPYTSAYLPVRHTGRHPVYLNLTYSNWDLTTSYNRYELLSDILNLFLLILFVALILSEIFYRILTKPFKRLHEAMGNIAHMQKIDAIGSSRKIGDEIALLVQQYNRMIDYLEESYRQLARSEREVAWREMARQIAHEIKNPLTPMRLKIQMLQRALEQQDYQTLRPRIESTLTLLLEQTDMLARIAGEFSDFARLSEGQSSRLDLLPLLCHVTQLYSDYENITVQRNFPCDASNRSTLCLREGDPGLSGPVWITADKEYLTRVFVNLCQNAVQALGSRPGGEVAVQVKVYGSRVWVSVSDNGPGIPDELRSRIFEPNFTTKSGGSGLGLAISRKIITMFGGNIVFDSVPGKGTVFTVDLPLHQADAEQSLFPDM